MARPANIGGAMSLSAYPTGTTAHVLPARTSGERVPTRYSLGSSPDH